MIATSASIELASRSGVLEHDAFEDVGYVLASIGRRLEVVDDVAPLHHLDRVEAASKQRGEAVAVGIVGLVLEPIDLDAQVEHLLRLLDLRQELDRLVDGYRRVLER